MTGDTYRNDTEASIEDEEWEGDLEPNYITYLKAKEEWLCDHAERRYNKEYYLERLSRPRSPGCPDGHGLSPKTLSRLEYLNGRINHIMKKCTVDGVAYPERLSDGDYKLLQSWRDALADFGNPFNADGTRKTGEALTAALELQGWNHWVQERNFREVDLVGFDEECDKILAEVRAGKRPFSDYTRFIECNSELGIDPFYFEKAFKGNRAIKDWVAQLWNQSAKRVIKTKNLFIKDFSGVIWSSLPDGSIGTTDIFTTCRQADLIQERKRRALDAAGIKSGINPEDFKEVFSITQALYLDENGMCMTKEGVKFVLNSEEAKRNLYAPLSWHEYILKQYTDAVMDGRMTQCKYVETDGTVHIKDMTTEFTNREEVESWINNNLLSYTRFRKDKRTGLPVYDQVPLSIFSIMKPNNQAAIRRIPTGRFASNYNVLRNLEFDTSSTELLQPSFDLYGDEEFANFVARGDKKAQYYATLLDVMEQHWKMLGLDSNYNKYKLPQIEAPKSQVAGRSLKDAKGSVKNIVKNIANATSDDYDMRSSDDYVYRNGKWVLKSAPMRFINELEDPNMINSDLASTVGSFAEMAINYINKSSVQARLETLGYALDDDTRDVEFKGMGMQ